MGRAAAPAVPVGHGAGSGSPAGRPGRASRTGRRACRGWSIRALLFVAGAGTLGAVQAATWGIAELMQGLAERGPERATFVERKYLAILDQPLESSGELRYVPPDRLEKRTLKPQPETAILERDLLTLERGGQKRTLRMRDYPEIAVFVESIRGTLAGDRNALERVYRLELHGGRERWTLVMFPSEAKLAAMVLRVDVTGTRDRVRTIEILQADGDRSVLSVERVAGTAAATGTAGAAGPAGAPAASGAAGSAGARSGADPAGAAKAAPK